MLKDIEDQHEDCQKNAKQKSVDHIIQQNNRYDSKLMQIRNKFFKERAEQLQKKYQYFDTSKMFNNSEFQNTMGLLNRHLDSSQQHWHQPNPSIPAKKQRKKKSGKK